MTSRTRELYSPALARGATRKNSPMPRANRPRRPRRPGHPTSGPPGQARDARPEDGEDFDLERVLAGFARLESAPDGDWRVRQVTTRSAAKDYTCPGCSRTIPLGVAHLVVWADDHLFGEEAGIAERRHWHTHCWRTRTFKYR